MRWLTVLVALCAASYGDAFWASLFGSNYDDRDDGVYAVDFTVNLKTGRVRTFTVEVRCDDGGGQPSFRTHSRRCTPSGRPLARRASRSWCVPLR